MHDVTIANAFFWLNIVSCSPAYFTFDNEMSNILKRQVIKKMILVIQAAYFLLKQGEAPSIMFKNGPVFRISEKDVQIEKLSSS